MLKSIWSYYSDNKISIEEFGETNKTSGRFY